MLSSLLEYKNYLIMKRTKHPFIKETTIILSNGSTYKSSINNNTKRYTDISTDIYNHLLWSVPVTGANKGQTYKGQQLKFINRYNIVEEN
jgi:hypothetical protein|tara:strand:- start:1010 stop:1279 length:270 start_codon:yes stop_codon:yes gene_type:complete